MLTDNPESNEAALRVSDVNGVMAAEILETKAPCWHETKENMTAGTVWTNTAAQSCFLAAGQFTKTLVTKVHANTGREPCHAAESNAALCTCLRRAVL